MARSKKFRKVKRVTKKTLREQIVALEGKVKAQASEIRVLQSDNTSLENVLIKAGVLVEVFDPPAPAPVSYDYKTTREETLPYDPYDPYYGYPVPTSKIIKKYAVVVPEKKATKHASK